MATRDRLPPTVPGSNPSGGPVAQVILLVVGAGHFAAHAMPVGGELLLGRDPACGVPLDHRKISRRHALVRTRPAPGGGCEVLVEDLGSTNGITAGNQRVASGATIELKLGDSFQVGPFTVVTVAEATGNDRRGPTEITIADPTRAGVPPAVERIAQSPVSILILGETGTGKEVLARTLHELSGRSGPFVGINTAALSEALLESELFGFERGAFTGANQTKPGLLETAPKGTVFLDEIGDLPAALQAKLLRAIETREVYRVGGLKPIALDVRFLAATHRDLSADVAAGRFRGDLYYRLNGITLRIAALRDRRAAITGLARTFLDEVAGAAHRPVPRLSLEAIARLARYDWPGNVRELRAVIERAFLLTEGDEIGPETIMIQPNPTSAEPESFLALARQFRGNVTAMARELATSRTQVHRLAQRFGIDLESLRER